MIRSLLFSKGNHFLGLFFLLLLLSMDSGPNKNTTRDWILDNPMQCNLGGGFKYFLVLPLLGEFSHFD